MSECCESAGKFLIMLGIAFLIGAAVYGAGSLALLAAGVGS